MTILSAADADALRAMLEACAEAKAIDKEKFNAALRKLHPDGVESVEDVADVFEEAHRHGGMHAGLMSKILEELGTEGAGHDHGAPPPELPPQPWALVLLEELKRRQLS